MTSLKKIIFLVMILIGIEVFAQAPTSPPVAATPPQATPQQPAGFYYYCNSTHAYFPAVQTCAESWVAIPVNSPTVQQPAQQPPQLVQPMYEQPVYYQRVFPRPNEIMTGRPNSLSVELFGRAYAYSLDYDLAVTSHITLGVGISSWQMSDWWNNYNATVTVVPVYGNYYFSEYRERGFVTLGVDWISVTQAKGDNDVFSNNGAAAVVGGGWEYREPYGFFYRLGGYLIAGKSALISPSVVIGYSF